MLLLIQARFIFDSIAVDYPNMRRYLSADASIVKNEQFERAAVKLLNGKELYLTDFERRAATTWRLTVPSSSADHAQEYDHLNNVS